ncbi:MAG TPA: ATP-dependent DNA helicase [Actinocrinis sp.]|uniref:ATP-dependent helicase n=1 Tax=Actinocrinis sp. TaxID=1920516 RepID=UPI002D48343E|nr:ATP-dependent DNA helicase [Actinocrinis sp.]HZU57221.1 ATP-dependent DNA helicase [Actinocrinis sp.]
MSTPAAPRSAQRSAAPFRLLPPPLAYPVGGLRLDNRQRSVVEHRGGPLLVLAGPGTGKTTTLVEAVLDRTRGPDALSADEILVLTFSRAAAAELRDRIGARLTPGAGAPTATTFHSFCFGLVGQYQEPELFGDPLRLLSGPEQDVVIRELVRGTIEPGGWGREPGGWPQALRAALGTRGFAEELRAVLLRARDLGLDPEDLAEFAARADRSDWRAAARFYAEYLDVADARGVLDYTELVHRAVLLSETEEVRALLRHRYRAVFVDEYQDTDSAQVRLLQALAGDGRDLVAVGDPDQSIYAFRGADLSGILDFPEQFRRRDGEPADIVVLQNSRRAAPTLLKASRQVAKRIPITRLPAEHVREHRELVAVEPDSALEPAQSTALRNNPYGVGRVEAIIFPDEAAELAAIADLLRRAHLEHGVPWEDMAVLVRDGQQLAPVRRALLGANVPAEVLGDDLPLAQEPAVATLLTALRCAAEPAALTPDSARELLMGPLGGMDSGDLRRLGRALRAEEQAALAAARRRRSRAAEADADGSAASDGFPASEAAASDPAGSDDSAAPDDLPDSGAAAASDRAVSAGFATSDDFPGSAAAAADPAVSAGFATSGDSPDSEFAASDHAAASATESDMAAPPSLDPADLADSVPAARPAEHLIREAVADPRLLATLDPKVAGSALVVARLLQGARDLLAEGGVVEDVLWLLWNGDTQARPAVRTGWPERLRRAVERGGPAGRLADRDLDAVIALFSLAARAQERTGYVGVTDFISGLQAQAIAATTLAEKASRGGAVQVLTAHRSKGLEWRVVVLAGVQEGLWPDLRRRGSLLEPDRIGRTGLTEPLSPAAILAEERRLFYVAITRARERLVVTAVEGEDEDGETPSRFLRELGVEVRQSAGIRRRRPLNLSALIAELRRSATDPAAHPRLRAEAIRRLARLAAATAPDGARLVPNAHPRQWWGLYDYTENDSPIADPAAAVPLSASAVGALDACGLRWFLEHEASAKEPSTDAQGIGVLFHALAEEVAVGKTKADIDVLMDRLDRVWDTLPFDAPWKSEQEKRAARRALERFLVWHDGRSDGRVVAAVEHKFDELLTVGGVPVRLRGAIDRIETDAENRVYLVDFKTSVNPKTRAEAAKDPQLGVYQLVVEAGAFALTPRSDEPESQQAESADADADADASAGSETVTVAQAELVYPRDRSDAPGPTVLVQAGRSAQADPEWAARLVAEVAQRVLDERFHAYGDTSACSICRLKKACPKQPQGRELPT